MLRETRRTSFPPDPEDGLIARNIIGDVTEGVWSIRTVNDWMTKSPSLITGLGTGDGVTWTIGARQYWGNAEGPETVDWSDSRFSPIPEPSLGDVNVDGQVNGLDVDPFVETLLVGPYDELADMNLDGAVNGLDVDPFVAAVVGRGTLQAVPEPSGLVLVAVGLVGIWGFSWTSIVRRQQRG